MARIESQQPRAGPTTEGAAGTPIEFETVETEPVRVRVLPGGRVDSNNAGKYLGRAPKTLAMWRMHGIGPPWWKCGGRVFYNIESLDAYLRGKGV